MGTQRREHCLPFEFPQKAACRKGPWSWILKGEWESERQTKLRKEISSSRKLFGKFREDPEVLWG